MNTMQCSPRATATRFHTQFSIDSTNRAMCVRVRCLTHGSKRFLRKRVEIIHWSLGFKMRKAYLQWVMYWVYVTSNNTTFMLYSAVGRPNVPLGDVIPRHIFGF